MPGDGLLPASDVRIVAVPVGNQRSTIDADDARIDEQADGEPEIHVIQGWYKNPGLQQSKSARFGKHIRTEADALKIVLAWMNQKHEEAKRHVTLACTLSC